MKDGVGATEFASLRSCSAVAAALTAVAELGAPLATARDIADTSAYFLPAGVTASRGIVRGSECRAWSMVGAGIAVYGAGFAAFYFPMDARTSRRRSTTWSEPRATSPGTPV